MPQFSVIIPTWNRPDELVRCLRSFESLKYPSRDWELIVVNDGGDRSFSAITSDIKKSLPVRFVDIEHRGVSAARNFGAKLARGDYLAFTDDDCRVEQDWLLMFENGFEDGKWDALGGQSLNPFSNSIPARAYQYIVDFLYDYWIDETKNALLLVSNNVAYRRSVLEALGGFDENFTVASEDRELSFRLVAKGYRQRYYPDAKVWHHRNLTWWKYIRLQFRYGRGGYYFHEARKRIETDKCIEPHLRKHYYVELAQSLWHAKVPFLMWLLLTNSHIAHEVGKVYQVFHSFYHSAKGKD